MGNLYLGYQSAIEFWRAVGAGIAPMPQPTCITSIIDDVRTASEAKWLLPPLDVESRQPIHMIVGHKNGAFAARDVIHHVCSQALPPGAFCRITDQVLVASPLLCLLHAAQITPQKRLLPLIELAFELLGSYSLCDGTKRGFMQHDPFASMSDLGLFISQLPPHTRGIRMLERAAGITIPGSASPRETDSAILLTLPGEYGGYGFPRPILNKQVDICEPYRSMTDKECFYLDLFWEGANTAFEYDGADHTDLERISEDKTRRNLLATMGYRLIVVENAHVSDAHLFNQQIGQLARLLGVTLQRPSDALADTRTKLRNYLFDTRHRYLSPLTAPIALKVQSCGSC